MLNSPTRDIFLSRNNLKPYEYPELYEYVDSIRHSYWVHSEFNYTSDVQDYKLNISESEREALRRTMLAIAQVEVAVKTFWGDIYKRLPKPEIGAVGATFAECEVRHADAYAHLLEILGLNEDFETLLDNPVMAERVKYLGEASKIARSQDDKDYFKSVILFALFIEHISLFSQFLIIMSFNKERNLFKGMSNAVEATSKEEQIHGLFGIDIVNIIKKEHPEWFDDETYKLIIDSSHEAMEAEARVLDWIFENGELDFLPRDVIDEFLKNRFNKSLGHIGVPAIFEIDDEILEKSDWFDNEVITTKHTDFFYKRSINYNKKSKSVTHNDLF